MAANKQILAFKKIMSCGHMSTIELICLWQGAEMNDVMHLSVMAYVSTSVTLIMMDDQNNHQPATMSSARGNLSRMCPINPTSVHAWRFRMLFFKTAIKTLHISAWNSNAENITSKTNHVMGRGGEGG